MSTLAREKRSEKPRSRRTHQAKAPPAERAVTAERREPRIIGEAESTWFKAAQNAPLQLSIMGRPWALWLAEGLIHDWELGPIDGMMWPRERLIAVSNTLDALDRRTTFYHELGHAAHYTLGSFGEKLDDEGIAGVFENAFATIDAATLDRVERYLAGEPVAG